MSGMASGLGTSGNVAWNNSVRARMYFKKIKAKDDDDDEAPSDHRELEVMKSNYGPEGEKVKIIWKEGVFIPIDEFSDPIAKSANEARANQVFLACLRRHIDLKLGQISNSEKSRSNFAPKTFARMKEAQGLNWRVLAAAMDRLLDAKQIVLRQWGSPSRNQVSISLPDVQTDLKQV
jgi:RecA-family ATPase